MLCMIQKDTNLPYFYQYRSPFLRSVWYSLFWVKGFSSRHLGQNGSLVALEVRKIPALLPIAAL